MAEMYGTLADANTYFQTRLHSDFWFEQTTGDRTKALYTATALLDALNFKGRKHAEYLVIEADPDNYTDAQLRVANASQALEFPRDDDTTVPTEVNQATYEIAYSLLDGVDPDVELENIAVRSQAYAGVRTAYFRDQQPIEHLINGIPSARAWRIIRPFLRDETQIKLTRV
jgi:hypothetical protein